MVLFRSWYWLFTYAIYVGTLSILYATGKIKSPKTLEIVAGCGVNNFRDLDEVEMILKFEETLKGWNAKKISDDELRNALTDSDYSKSNYFKHKGENEFEIDKIILKRFETKDFVSLLK